MIAFYIASTTYQEVISRAVKDADMILDGSECSNDFYFAKYMKLHMVDVTNVDVLLLDISALKDTDEEILDALDALRLINFETRIIILAANRMAGDDFLGKCFQMSIYDLIVTDDFLEIKNELDICLKQGKQYKDAVHFKDKAATAAEQIIIKTEIKQTVNKVMIAVAGIQPRVGVTHNSIVLANFLRKKGYMIAVVELSDNQSFEHIREACDEKLIEDSFYSMAGVDFYPNSNADKLGSVLGKSYNFVIGDFGTYQDTDKVTFNKADVRIMISGSKPWEYRYMDELFRSSDSETLQQYHYCFNFTDEKDRGDIRRGMDILDKVYFLAYQPDPFSSGDFSGADKILEKYMPVRISSTAKRGFFKRKRE